MPLSREELDRIQRLRALFLDDARGDRALLDYWRCDADLVAYERVLGARIGWKWDAALAECKDRGMPRTDDAVVLDFGCGAGIAAMRYASAFGAREILCQDRSQIARNYAARAVAAAHPSIRSRAIADADECAFDVLLVSHVVSELDAASIARLAQLALRARFVVIVESGNKAAARKLAALRDQLVPRMHVVAPCTHSHACPSLRSPDDWCHFFADPPQAAFTEGEWAHASRDLGIDLRALPYAFLCLSRDPIAAKTPPHRLLGRPEVKKHDARVQLCEDGALREESIDKRTQKETWRLLKKDPAAVRNLPDA
jgi:ribosomal protein RSM22 (predicted rRNA methylase)